jgi:hypothetical protein
MANYEEEKGKILDSVLPEEREGIKKIIGHITDELMEKTQQVRILQKELKQAIERKEAIKDPLVGHVAMVLCSKPKGEDLSKTRMHVADKVDTNRALMNMKNLIKDRDNDFYAAFYMQPMIGRSDAKERLEINTECAWQLFKKLEKDLKIYDQKKDVGQEDLQEKN